MANNFSVTRTSQTLVTPSEHTPCHVLDLSVIDTLPVLRCNAQTLHIFRHAPQADQAKPADVIQEALSRALVPYYPLAGRLKSPSSGADNDIQLDCSGEGVLFVTASADSTLDHITSYLFDQEEDTAVSDLLPIPVSGEEKNGEPLVQMQVTQFACGGFVIGLIFCHAVCDGLGAAQFLNAVGDKARGLQRLTVEPVWFRDFISASPAGGSNLLPPLPPPPPSYELKHVNVDISFEQINQLKLGFREESITASSFEIVAASCWMSRARAIKMASSSTEIRGRDYKLVFFANCRELLEPPAPKGFYGNCFFPVTITSSVEFVALASHAQVVKLIQEAKVELPAEFRKFLKRFNGGGCGDDDVAKEDPFAPPLSYNTLFISEWGRLGFNQVDYGWGPPVHLVPIQGSSIIPVGIVGSLPLPRKGVRLMTWCVHEAHLQPFLSEMANLTNK